MTKKHKETFRGYVHYPDCGERFMGDTHQSSSDHTFKYVKLSYTNYNKATFLKF